jgi:hypothetical protein
MKLSRTIAITAASVMAAALGFIGAGAASAATAEPFCVARVDVCANARGSNPVAMLIGQGVTGYWYADETHGPAQIQQAHVDLCLQLDHAKSNEVIEAKCNGASYQKWQGASVVENGEIVSASYVSQWNKNLCLTYNESKEILDAVTCDSAWYQVFGS